MCKVICVTCRGLAGSGFTQRLGDICGGEQKPDRVILREKDMSREDYFALAGKILPMCGGVSLSVHSHFDMREISGDIHLGFTAFVSHEFRKIKGDFNTVGVSVHSAREAKTAAENGADYIIAGHIFATDCKKGLPPRGVDFLRDICGCVNVPVYAIGGITPDNAGLCVKAGAAGVCVMSSLMKCGDPGEYILRLKTAMNNYRK